MNRFVFGLILFSVSLNAFAQIFLRRGMMERAAPSLSNLGTAAISVATNPWIWCGMASYAISILSWLYVLSKLQVSVAYPFLSIGYIIAAVTGYAFLGETLGMQRVLGILLIGGGLIFLSRSSS
ncbi:MAG TPA: SMR family transporter [Rhizomicrobium sp.]|jgi:multidrug transporter EmrE-like cation transporter|nr:SMR family transporter [Rhizomicrobium sp.]